MLRYSRQYEEEADREAIRMLASAQIDPEALVRFFQSMKKGNPAVVRMPAYLSTHPNLDARITKARRLIAELQPVQRPLLKEYNWRDIRAICSTIPQPKP
jgi:predicted Zn-dependent protease